MNDIFFFKYREDIESTLINLLNLQASHEILITL